jgi:tripartite-type tricarboxylate transporter receptor subunit TctC
MGQIYVTNQISGVETGYNTKSDLEILGTAATMPNVLACKKSLAINKIADLDGKNFNYGVAGYGSSEHIATEALFAKIKGNNQVIPYAQGGATAVVDLLAGNLDCMFANYPTIKPFITDERVTVLLSSHELGLGIPTWRNIYREDFPFQSYLSVIVSKNMDQDKRRKITRDLEAVFNTDSFRTDLKNIGFFVVAKTDAKTTKQVDAAMDKLRAFILLNSIKIQ